MQTKPIPPETKRKIYSWIRGAFAGMVGYSAILVLVADKWDWLPVEKIDSVAVR